MLAPGATCGGPSFDTTMSDSWAWATPDGRSTANNARNDTASSHPCRPRDAMTRTRATCIDTPLRAGSVAGRAEWSIFEIRGDALMHVKAGGAGVHRDRRMVR